MEEKKSKKSIVLLILLIIAIIAICVMGFFIYSLSSEKSNIEEQLDTANQQISDLQNEVNTLQEQINPTTETTLQNGNYVINGMTVTPDEGSYGIESITISENNTFSINLPLGTSYIGTYTIDNNTITCNANQETNLEGGGTANTELSEAFQFEIVDSSNLRLLSASNESLNLTVGMLYTLEGSEQSTSAEENQETNSVDISGVWTFQSGLLNDQEVSASDIFGSTDETIIGNLTFNNDGTFSDLIGKTSITDTTQTSGTYTFDGNTINLVYANNETQTLTYNSADNTIQYPASNYIYVLARNQ